MINLKVSNSSNLNQGENLTDEIIQHIFNFSTYSSTKRNQFKIIRRSLGHGLKTVLGASYALATEKYGYDNWSALKISSGNSQWVIGIKVDRIDRDGTPIAIDIKSKSIIEVGKIIIEIAIPVDKDSKTMTRESLMHTFYQFAMLNPHVTMNTSVDSIEHNYPRVQKIKLDWKNLHSIHSYSYRDFEDLIFSIKADNATLYDVITSIGLRESHFLGKEEFNIPIIFAKHDKNKIKNLYDSLKKTKPPREKLDLPYDMRVNRRKLALKKRLQQFGILVSRIKYNMINGTYTSLDGEIQFPEK